jgi:F0F1-type ATP synthase membrane subunit c/vacuolar-type H+-ATPase subunit K
MKDVNRRSGSRLSWMISAIPLTVFFLFASWNANAALLTALTQPQRGHAIGVGTSCAGALTALARQPEMEEKIREVHSEGVEAIKRLRPSVHRAEVAEAIGLLKAAQVEAVARNPGTEGQLGDLADTCVEDVMSFINTRR